MILEQFADFGCRLAVVPGVLLRVRDLDDSHVRFDITAFGHKNPALLIDPSPAVAHDPPLICESKGAAVAKRARPLCDQCEAERSTCLRRDEDTLHATACTSIWADDGRMRLGLRICRKLKKQDAEGEKKSPDVHIDLQRRGQYIPTNLRSVNSASRKATALVGSKSSIRSILRRKGGTN